MENPQNPQDIEYRKVQGIVGQQSFSIVLPKSFAHDLGISKGDYVKVSQEDGKIIIEKMEEKVN
jgi:AbrB family looped-hinge helix DNA binding protein